MTDIILTLADDYAASYANVIDSLIKRQKLADEITRLRAEVDGLKRKPLTDAEIDEMLADANRGHCIERDDYIKAVRDAEQAHGIGA